MLELVLGLSVLAMATVGMNQLADRWSDDTRNTVAASQVRTFGEATRSYIKDNYAAVRTIATPTAPALIDVGVLIAAGKLPAGYGSSNAFGHATCALVLQPVPDRLQAMVITEGGSAVGDPSLAQIASVIGGSGGAVYASAPANVQGAVGGWSLAASTFDNRANQIGRRCDGSAGNVRLAAGHPMMALWFESGDTSAAFLARDAVPARPELNAMNTPLVMKAVQAANTACGANGAIAQDGVGRILSCQSGVWRMSGDGTCTPTTADLNFLEEGGRCYNGVALPNSPAASEWVFVEVFRHFNAGNFFVTQRVMGMTGQSIGKTWIRTQNAAVPGPGWTPWNQVNDPDVRISGGNVDAFSSVNATGINARGNLTAGQGVIAGGDIASRGTTYTLSDTWSFIGRTAAGAGNTEPASARGSVDVNDVFVRSVNRWVSQLAASGMSRVGVNGVAFRSNGDYVWLTVTVSAKYAPVDGTHVAFSDWLVFIDGSLVSMVQDSVSVGKFGDRGHYWAYESFGVEQRQFNVFVPRNALVQVVPASSNLLISGDIRVDLTQ